MKGAAMKSTHTDFISHNICLFDLRLMIESLWEEAECMYMCVRNCIHKCLQ